SDIGLLLMSPTLLPLLSLFLPLLALSSLFPALLALCSSRSIAGTLTLWASALGVCSNRNCAPGVCLVHYTFAQNVPLQQGPHRLHCLRLQQPPLPPPPSNCQFLFPTFLSCCMAYSCF
ncbi:mCG146076, partial [Mus musculus]